MDKIINKNIFLDISKSNFYINNRIRGKFSGLEESKKKILTKFNINNKKILDIGCATGDFYNALKNKYKINYTGIDIDPKCISFAKKRFNQKVLFKNLDIFNKRIKNNSYDVVMIWNLFYMFPNWKQFLVRACEISKEYVMFDNKIRLSGSTVVDKDLSYQYYHKSQERNYYVIHNIHELISFFQIHELNLEYVYGYGYKLPGKTSARLPLNQSDVMVGSFVLKKSKKLLMRTGVTAESANKSWVNFELNFPGFKYNL